MTYLASPYSHPDPEVRAYRFRVACVAAAELMRRGEVVVSPIAHSHPIAVYGKLQGDFDTWSRLDMELLAACDKAAVLEGFGFVGIDLSEEYAEIAQARISHAMAQGRLGV